MRLDERAWNVHAGNEKFTQNKLGEAWREANNET